MLVIQLFKKLGNLLKIWQDYEKEEKISDDELILKNPKLKSKIKDIKIDNSEQELCFDFDKWDKVMELTKEKNKQQLSIKVQKLKNILLAYAKRNLSIGYVQGFNDLTTPFFVALMGLKVFMASIKQTVCPMETRSPTLTNGTVPESLNK